MFLHVRPNALIGIRQFLSPKEFGAHTKVTCSERSPVAVRKRCTLDSQMARAGYQQLVRCEKNFKEEHY